MRNAFFVALVAAVSLTGQSQATPNRWCSEFNDSIFCDDFDRDCLVAEQPPPPQVCEEDSNKGDPQLRGIWRYSSFIVQSGATCGSNMTVEDVTNVLPTHPFGGRHANGGDEAGVLGQNTVDLGPYISAVMPGYTLANGSDSQPLVLTFTMGAGALGAMQYNNGYMELSQGDPDRWNPVTDPAKAVTDWIPAGTTDGTGCIDCSLSCPEGQTASHNLWPTICQQEFPNAACPPKMTTVRNALALGALALLDNNPCHCCPSTTPGKIGYASRCPEEYRNPDFPDGWQEPTSWHLSYFDGIEWRVLREGMGGPGSYGDFRWGNYWIYWTKPDGTIVGNTDSAWEEVRITIKTNTVDIYHKTKNVDPDGNGGWIETYVESLATDLPRRYSGGFNRLRAGTDEGCQLIKQGAPNYNNAYECDVLYGDKYGKRRCKINNEYFCGGGNAHFRSSAVAFDNARLYGGVGVMGACCLSDGTCNVMSPPDCATAQGTFRGSGTTCNGTICNGACCQPHAGCAQTLVTACPGRFRGPGTGCDSPCCPSPFADWDGDRDVDMDDFAMLQTCLTTGGGTLGAGCDCFDHNGANGIDQLDVMSFIDCVTGPSLVPESVAPECKP